MNDLKSLCAALDSAPVLNSTDGQKDKKIIVEIALTNGWCYEVYEADLMDNPFEVDYLCFGKVHGFETELGYFTLGEIEPYIAFWVDRRLTAEA